MRNRFWIIGGRRLVRQVKRRCMRCKRRDSAPWNEVTAPLPVQRTQFERPFTSCGIDYAGPLWVRDGANVCKVWLALFVCAASRVIHLEVVRSLQVDDFVGDVVLVVTAIWSLHCEEIKTVRPYFSRELIKQIAAWICCIARREIDALIARYAWVWMQSWVLFFVWALRDTSGRYMVDCTRAIFSQSVRTSAAYFAISLLRPSGKERNVFGSKSAIDSSTPLSKSLLLLHLTFKSMPKAKFSRCQHCRGRSRKRCQQSTNEPITAKP